MVDSSPEAHEESVVEVEDEASKGEDAEAELKDWVVSLEEEKEQKEVAEWRLNCLR